MKNCFWRVEYSGPYGSTYENFNYLFQAAKRLKKIPEWHHPIIRFIELKRGPMKYE